MQDLYHSIVKTEQSYIDNISIKDNRQGNDLGERIEQFRNILKWVHKRGPCDISHNEQKRSPSEYSYFMVRIESISNLMFKRVVSGSKVHAILVAKLVNIKSNRHYPKVTRSVKVLQQSNTYSFELREPICLYFYTHKQTELMLKIEVLLTEQSTKNEQAVPLFGSPENAGCIEIDFLKDHKDHKGKQKKPLTIPNEFTFYSRQGMEAATNSSAVSAYVVVKSEAYRYLESIIGEHTLCDPTDKIPGIMGYFLPLSQNALSEFALTPEAQGLQLSFANVQINSQLIREATVRAEALVKGRFSRITKISSSIGEMILHAKFHNGWKVVSSGSTIVKEKGDVHLKTNNSNISDLQNIQANKKTAGKTIMEGQIKPKIQYRRYACESPIELTLVFPQQDECVLIYQLVADVTVRGEIGSPQKKDLPDTFQQVIQIPLCFGISSAKSIGNYRSNSCILNVGGCLTSFQQLKDAVEYNLRQINQLKKIQASKTGMQSKQRIPSIAADFDNISINNRTQKTLENFSQMSWKNIKSEVGFLDFEMQLIERQQNMQENMNLSIPMDNISSLNASKIDIRDKIQSQKQRIAKESKKNVPIAQNNRLDISFTKQFIISENHRDQLLSKIDPPKQSNYYAKQSFLKLLKKQIKKNYQRAVNPHFQTAEQLKKKVDIKQHQQYIRMLYSINISRLQAQSIIEHRYSKYFYYLYSNYIIHEKYYFKYEETPIEIIKTELSEANYNNCYFINFIEINNHVNHQTVKFPKAFYFKMKFFNQDCIRSELMTINKDTGEILLINGQKSTDKIIHIEVNIDQEPTNYLMKFTQFIQYLHNGILNIEIMDYNTGLLFGTFTIPLRYLIRKRRNQVVYIHQDWIYHRNLVRGNMKVEVRAIRKMKNRIKIQHKSPQKEKQPSPIKEKKLQIGDEAETDKRMDRIQRFKYTKNKLPIKNGQSQLRSEISHVEKIINKAYAHERTKIMVSYLKKEFFFIEIANKHDESGTYRMTINDQDRRWIERNSLSGHQQLTIVKDPSKLEKEDYQILTSSKKNQERMMKSVKLTEEELIEMPARAKGFLLLCYLTVRRFPAPQVSNQDLVVYNRQRTINCSLINEKDGSIECISAIDIVPLPQEATIELEYYRPANQQSLIHIPFIDPQYLSAKIDQALIDDPYAVILSASNSSFPLITKFASLSTGIYVKLNNNIPQQSFKEYNLLLLADIKKKQMLLGESRKNDRKQSRFKTQSRIVPELTEDVSGPKMISLVLRVWGCLKFAVQVPLWGQTQGFITLPNEIFNKSNIKLFFLATDDEDALKFTQDRKNKYQNLQLLRVNEGQARTEIYYTATSHTSNESYISVHAIDGSQAIAQQESLKSRDFTYVQPFHRIVMVMQSFIPNFKEMLKINVNRASQGVVEEPFVYRSSSNKKTEFKIHSSDASLVWVKNNDTVFQIEGKGQRKIHISFHSQKIIERSGLTGTIEGVVLGVKWDRGIDYYGFKFNIY